MIKGDRQKRVSTGKAATPFGWRCRALRRQHDLRLSDLAALLGVTTSFLSQLETGRKAIPRGFVEKIVIALNISGRSAERLRDAAALSAREFCIRMSEDATPLDRELAFLFVQRFPTLPPARKLQILDFLERPYPDAN